MHQRIKCRALLFRSSKGSVPRPGVFCILCQRLYFCRPIGTPRVILLVLRRRLPLSQEVILGTHLRLGRPGRQFNVIFFTFQFRRRGGVHGTVVKRASRLPQRLCCTRMVKVHLYTAVLLAVWEIWLQPHIFINKSALDGLCGQYNIGCFISQPVFFLGVGWGSIWELR